MYLIIYKD